MCSRANFGSGEWQRIQHVAFGDEASGARFVGVDLTGQHVAGGEAAHGVANLEYVEGNYESLDFADGVFDVAFGVETFCQTDDMPRALTEMHRVLRPGGQLVVIDCFRQRPLDEFDADLQLAAKLVEKTTAVDGFAVISQWLDLARSIGFSVLEVEDESVDAVHEFARLNRLAARIFRRSGAGGNGAQNCAAVDVAKCYLRFADAVYGGGRSARLLSGGAGAMNTVRFKSC